MKTTDTTFRSKYSGAWKKDMLETFPDLVVLWAGYGFIKGYKQGRGHVYAIEDIEVSLRTCGPLNKEDGPDACHLLDM